MKHHEDYYQQYYLPVFFQYGLFQSNETGVHLTEAKAHEMKGETLVNEKKLQ